MSLYKILQFAFTTLLVIGLLPVQGVFQDADKTKKKEKKPLPLETTRKIEFTTSEGTWMSLDVSPDGKSVIFDLVGDIYQMPVSGGDAKVLLGGLAFESQPRFSPDGSMIAFISDRSGSNNLWISKSDGSDPKQLTKEKQAEFVSPEWSLDGNYVMASKSSLATRGAYEIWMFHKLGGGGLKVSKGSVGPAAANAPRASDFGVVATPGFLFYAKQAPRSGGRLGPPNTQIIKRNIVTSEEDGITFLPGHAFRPAVSPDGKLLVFGSRYEATTGLRIRNLESGDERWLKYPIQRDELESRPTRGILPGYSFTPDSRSLIISYGGKFKKLNVENGSESTIDFSADVSLDAGPSLYLDNKLETGPVRARLIQEPKISKDGRIAFSALTAVYLMDSKSAKPKRLTNSVVTQEYQPTWSPDGRSVAFVSWSTKGGHIWVSTVSGGTPKQITKTAAFYKDPVFTPDGKSIISLKTSLQTRVNHPSDFLGPQPGLDIVKISVENGSTEIIAPSRGLGTPHFGPESDRVYVYGNRGLISYRFDGTDARTHLKVVGASRGPLPNPASDVRISPDGSHAVARFRSGQTYLLMVPRVGGDVPTLSVITPPVPTKKLTTIGSDSFAWSDGGETINWTVGSTMFSQSLSEISFEPKKKPKMDAADGEEAKEEKAKPEEVEEEADTPKEEEESKASSIDIVIEQTRHVPKGTAVLRGAKVITMRGREVIDNADILVVDNRISAIGKRGSINIPQGAKIFDLAGKVIMPGIVDIHAHWEVRHSVLDTEDYTFLGNLAYGVTTGRDPQTSTNDTFAYQDLVDTGRMLGPRAFNTGPGIFSDTNFKSYEEARDTVARYKKHYRAETLKSYLVGNRQQRQWVVQASKELGIIPTTEGGSNFALNLTHAIDGFGGNEHSLPIVPLYNDVVQLFAKTGITYTPTLIVAYGGPSAKYYFFEKYNVFRDKKLRRFNPQAVLDEKTARMPYYRADEYTFPQIAEGANKILKAGGRVGVGGHGELQGLQCHWEMWGYAMGGMENHDILRTATILGAEAIGYGSEFGSLEAGKLADLIVLDKNPLEDIKNSTSIRYVMKNGEMFEGETLDQIYPAQKKLPEMWWWSGNPK